MLDYNAPTNVRYSVTTIRGQDSTREDRHLELLEEQRVGGILITRGTDLSAGRLVGLAAVLVAAGALYALLVGIVERATGLRLMSRMAEQVTFVMVPPLLLIFLVLGTIFIGVATPTEGGAMGALHHAVVDSVTFAFCRA